MLFSYDVKLFYTRIKSNLIPHNSFYKITISHDLMP